MNKTINELKELFTGKSIKESELKPAVLKGLILNENNILFAFSHGLFYVKNEVGVMIYTKDEILETYGIEITKEIINKLSIK